MTRHQMREAAFLLTFERIFNQTPAKELIEIARECDEFPLCPEAEQLFLKVDEKTPELDQIISKHLNKWTIQRISKVSLAVMRLAVYEMKFVPNLQDDIVISEAVKIAQAYTMKDDVTFVNGVLASISREAKTQQA